MLSRTFALLAALAAPALATTGTSGIHNDLSAPIVARAETRKPQRPGMWYSILPNAGDGFEHVSAEFYLDPSSTWIEGYYASTSWDFVGHDLQYFGLQPRAPGSSTTGHLAYSVFGPGSTIGDPERCSAGADYGHGVSCSLDIDIDAGRWYKIESNVDEHGALGRRWNGTLIDDTGKRTYIASFWTDDKYGKLAGKGISQWLEWWPFNNDGLSPEQRECQAPFVATFRVPKAHVEGKTLEASTSSPFQRLIDDKCAVRAKDANYHCVVNSDGTVTAMTGIHNNLA